MAENDGTFQCKRCRKDLNITDVNCWRCGSKDIQDMRAQPKDELVLLDVEDILKVWAITT